ncbi:MAG TPA: hypothetical protein VMH87_01515 [Pseudomonadales bacterium]|nr:hypothetical protein [Pseudomonadales bacterium]
MILMKRLGIFASPLLVAALAATGCSKSGSSPSALTAAELPATVNSAFNKSSDQTKEVEATFVADFQNQDPAAAFAQLQKLRAERDLTPQQQGVVVRAWMTTMQQLQTAAQNGNPSAQTALHQYLSSR